MKIAIVVIIYNPDEKVFENILSYMHKTKRIFLVDNSEVASTNNLFKVIVKAENVVLINDGENKGIANRLNQVVKLAIKENFDWLLTMDQDSRFLNDNIDKYFNCIEKFENKDLTAVFGVQYEDKLIENNICLYKDINHLITSGSILNLKLFEQIGSFDEALFIDKVDTDYCLQARLLGYKIIQIKNIYLEHNLGSVYYGRSLKNFKISQRILHSPIRMYYIIRNYLYLSRKYKGNFPTEIQEMRYEVFLRTKNNFIYGTQKMKLIKMLFRGFLDFKLNRMGRLEIHSK